MLPIYPPPPLPDPSTPEGLFDYIEGPQFGPEAESAVFVPLHYLPIFDVRYAISLWAHGQGPYAMEEKPIAVFPSIPVSGLGGIQTGQFVLQPLEYEGE